MANEELRFDNLQQVLAEYSQAVVSKYREQLLSHDRKASGALIDSITERIDYDGRQYAVVLRLQDYWRYIEYGTRPHWPPTSAILRWIQIKPVIPRPDARGRIPSQKQLAYLIARKIAREGTEGSNDLGQSVEMTRDEWMVRIREAFRKDCNAYTDALIKIHLTRF